MRLERGFLYWAPMIVKLTFRVLKINRTEPYSLQITDDGRVYDPKEINDLVRMMEDGNKSKVRGQKIRSGLQKVASAYGIIGYSYDLTHTFQYNVEIPTHVMTKNGRISIKDFFSI
ncbi:FIG4 [Lepeophtheirus salmonis]|uniref:FIG4 n=1 Tax=Lepeophtheirus salmonis TaxID=72036 RepID=A0A7R8D5D2_LEPSM|nr:FIG4 [Lepeophtheirus salmonis]CAF3034361.1 FIG4 [Lepeophtheirus salmonis]